LIIKCEEETSQPEFNDEMKIEYQQNIQFTGLHNYLKWIINQTSLKKIREFSADNYIITSNIKNSRH